MKRSFRDTLMLILLIGIQATFAQAVWKGNIDTDWYTGNASVAEYTITTPQQLAGLAKLVNNGNNFKGKTVKIGANIMLNDTTNWENWASKPPANKWTPIGTKDSMCRFAGIFDGSDHIISGVYINTASNGQGLFRNIDPNGTIKNLGVIASYIKGNFNIGGLVGGYNQGTISKSHFNGIVTGDTAGVGGLAAFNDGTINSSYSNSKVTGDTAVGGLVGGNLGTINNSYSNSKVAGNSDIGGLVGTNGGEINNSYSTGAATGDRFVGGLVGLSIKGSINNGYSTGTVTGDRFVGGLVGLNREESKINGSYSTGAVTGKTDVGGLVGHNNKSKINKSYSTGVVTGEFAVGGLVGENREGEISNSYFTGIVTTEDLIAGGLVGQNNRGKISKSYSIGTVTGNSHVGGLVGENGGEINNSYFIGTVKGGEFVGGLVGLNYYLITEDINSIKSMNNGTITARENVSAGAIIKSYSTGTVTGISKVGGLVGNRPTLLVGRYSTIGYADTITDSYYDIETSNKSIHIHSGEGKTTAQMKQRATFRNWDFDKIWGIKSTINNGYPYLLENKGK